MTPNICLLACTLFLTQTAERNEWPTLPQLNQGQELVFRGTYVEETLGRAVRFTRSYRLENRVFVIRASEKNLEVAICSTFKIDGQFASEQAGNVTPTSVHLEVIKVLPGITLQSESGVSLLPPLDGPVTMECGAFVEVPAGECSPGTEWRVSSTRRPPLTWKVVGRDSFRGSPCLKLSGVQQSADWDQPRADTRAWRRLDTVLFSPAIGLAYRVERTIELREPAHLQPTHKSVMAYELQSSIMYPGPLFEDRRREVALAQNLQSVLTSAGSNPARVEPQSYEIMHAKIAHHLEAVPKTPYREAILQVKQRIEAAQRGEAPPRIGAEDAEVAENGANSRGALQIATRNLVTNRQARLADFLGQPIVLAFYGPKSHTAEPVIKFLQQIQESSPGKKCVLALATTDERDEIARQQQLWQFTVPVLSGMDLLKAYKVEETPTFVILDGSGAVRSRLSGWGPEMAAEISLALKEASQPAVGGTEQSLPGVTELKGVRRQNHTP